MTIDDDRYARDGRNETEAERLDRNWTELLQELRVIQTGTQILTGFLLTLAFQQRFTELDGDQVDIYLALVTVAALTTVLALAPVALHRGLFRQRAKRDIVRVANRILKVTIAAVGVTLVGTVLLIFDVVIGHAAGIVAAAVAAVIVTMAWVVLPFGVARKRERERR